MEYVHVHLKLLMVSPDIHLKLVHWLTEGRGLQNQKAPYNSIGIP